MPDFLTGGAAMGAAIINCIIFVLYGITMAVILGLSDMSSGPNSIYQYCLAQCILSFMYSIFTCIESGTFCCSFCSDDGNSKSCTIGFVFKVIRWIGMIIMIGIGGSIFHYSMTDSTISNAYNTSDTNNGLYVMSIVTLWLLVFQLLIDLVFIGCGKSIKCCVKCCADNMPLGGVKHIF